LRPTASRCRGSPRRRSHAGSIPRVVLYAGAGCGLCERAKEQLERLAIPYELVDITGDPGLESRYREWLPVLEIDGRRAFVYYLDEAALLRKLQRT
jgi:glutaredoxin